MYADSTHEAPHAPPCTVPKLRQMKASGERMVDA